MQIKRFEAADMTEALRMVKREFGDDAVILSASEIRPGGFFSALRKKSVEITAAMDYPADEASTRDDFSEMLSQHLDTDRETDRVSLSSPRTMNALASKTQSLKNLPPVQDRSILQAKRWDTRPEADRIADDIARDPEMTICPGGNVSATAGWVRHMTTHNLVADPFYRDTAKPKIIAVVGPSGVGKSTTVAKLAWRCQTVEKKRTGLISLDRYRIGANAMLVRIAEIMDLPLTVVHDAEQLHSAVNDLATLDVVLIDTPGMSGMDASMMDDICTLVRSANPDETHLVANATARKEVLAATVNHFSPLGVDHLIFTHMDEYTESPSVLTLLTDLRLPVSFYADAVDLFDGLKETKDSRLDGLSHQMPSSGGQVTAFTKKRRQENTSSALNADPGNSGQYVANRNSELFHHPNCKSVKRINAENITAFNSIEEAIDEGFKPCRACCPISMIRKPVPTRLRYQRASAI